MLPMQTIGAGGCKTDNSFAALGALHSFLSVEALNSWNDIQIHHGSSAWTRYGPRGTFGPGDTDMLDTVRSPYFTSLFIDMR